MSTPVHDAYTWNDEKKTDIYFAVLRLSEWGLRICCGKLMPYHIRLGNRRNIVDCHMIQGNKSKHDIKDQFALEARRDLRDFNICFILAFLDVPCRIWSVQKKYFLFTFAKTFAFCYYSILKLPYIRLCSTFCDELLRFVGKNRFSMFSASL